MTLKVIDSQYGRLF